MYHFVYCVNKRLYVIIKHVWLYSLESIQ